MTPAKAKRWLTLYGRMWFSKCGRYYPGQKTALSFYLAFAGLLLIVTGWSPVKPAVSDQRSSDGQGLVNGVTDLSGIR